MAYTDVSELAVDQDLRQRLYACVASLNVDNATLWVDRWVWVLVAGDESWADRWAVASETSARRGWDAGVVSDQMIWDRVRAVQEDKGRDI